MIARTRQRGIVSFHRRDGAVRNVRIVIAAVGIFAGASIALADLAALTTFGPNSGSVVSNLGAVPGKAVGTRMGDAVVNVVLKAGPGEDLVADCRATFTMETGESDETDLVAFPYSGQSGDAVRVNSFSVSIDGKAPRRRFNLPIQPPNPCGRLAASGTI